MKKIFIFSLFLLSTSLLFASYNIKIAVYKDHDNLMRFIAKVPKAEYRKNIIIKKKNHLNYVTSVSYEYEKEVQRALRAYKKIFPDAFIEEVKTKKNSALPKKVIPATIAPVMAVETAPVSKPSLSEVSPAVPVSKPVVSVAKTVVPVAEPLKANILDAKQLLENRTVYLCKEDLIKDAKKEIIKLDFKADYVLYSKRRRDTLPLKIPYTYEKDTVLLSLSGMQFKYQLLKEEEGYLLAQSYINKNKGKRFRFYFDENVALAFSHNAQN